MRVNSLFLGGAILELPTPLPVGADLGLDLSHPALGSLTTNVRVAWCRQVPNLENPLAAVAFHNTWDGLVTLRQQLAAYLGNRVFDGSRFVGYVLQEPNDVASSCFDVQTGKVALIGPNGQGYSVRRRDALPGSPLEEAANFIEAVGVAFALERAPTLNVPSAPEPIPEPSPEDSDEEIFGMNTVVLKPENVGISSDEEDEILGARTVVVKPDESSISGADSAVLGGGGFGPKSKRNPHSKVFDGDEHVGFVACSVAEGSWNVYGQEGKKLALVAGGGGSFRVCVMGRKADESLVFLEAETPSEALRLAFEREDSTLRVDPPLEGFDS